MIKELVCTCKGSILINRSPCGFFSSSCGFCQGCPLSSCLFIIVKEILSLNVQKPLSKGQIQSVSPVPRTPCHFFYTDDIMFYVRASIRDLRKIKYLLESYQNAAGQVFNIKKPHLFLGNATTGKNLNLILLEHSCGIPSINLPRSSLFL